MEKQLEIKVENNNSAVYAKIRYVEGYQPESFLEEGYNADGTSIRFLPLKHKKRWAALVCPRYAIDVVTLVESEEECIVEAHFYEDVNDIRPRFKRKGSCHTYQLQDINIPQNKLKEELFNVASGSAQSRVLREAGFGLAFEYEEETYLEQFTKTANQLRKEMANTTVTSHKAEDDFAVQINEPCTNNANANTKGKKRSNQEIYDDNVDIMIDMLGKIRMNEAELLGADEATTISLKHEIELAKAKYKASAVIVQEKIKKDAGKGKLSLRQDCPSLELQDETEDADNKAVTTNSQVIDGTDKVFNQEVMPETSTVQVNQEVCMNVKEDKEMTDNIIEEVEVNLQNILDQAIQQVASNTESEVINTDDGVQEMMFMDDVEPGDFALSYGKYAGIKIKDVSVAELLFLYKKETDKRLLDAIKTVLLSTEVGKAKFERAIGMK